MTDPLPPDVRLPDTDLRPAEPVEPLHRSGPVRDVHGNELPGSRPDDDSDVLDDPQDVVRTD
jgi:hypothetical protein